MIRDLIDELLGFATSKPVKEPQVLAKAVEKHVDHDYEAFALGPQATCLPPMTMLQLEERRQRVQARLKIRKGRQRRGKL